MVLATMAGDRRFEYRRYGQRLRAPDCTKVDQNRFVVVVVSGHQPVSPRRDS